MNFYYSGIKSSIKCVLQSVLHFHTPRCTDVDEAAGKTGCYLQRSHSVLEVLG